MSPTLLYDFWIIYPALFPEISGYFDNYIHSCGVAHT